VGVAEIAFLPPKRKSFPCLGSAFRGISFRKNALSRPHRKHVLIPLLVSGFSSFLKMETPALDVKILFDPRSLRGTFLVKQTNDHTIYERLTIRAISVDIECAIVTLCEP
jgi:hypothetical protein